MRNLRGKLYRVGTTHLETFNLDIQAAQALELVNGPVISNLPVVLAGDLNSDADNPDPAQSPAYHILRRCWIPGSVDDSPSGRPWIYLAAAW